MTGINTIMCCFSRSRFRSAAIASAVGQCQDVIDRISAGLIFFESLQR